RPCRRTTTRWPWIRRLSAIQAQRLTRFLIRAAWHCWLASGAACWLALVREALAPADSAKEQASAASSGIASLRGSFSIDPPWHAATWFRHRVVNRASGAVTERAMLRTLRPPRSDEWRTGGLRDQSKPRPEPGPLCPGTWRSGLLC